MFEKGSKSLLSKGSNTRASAFRCPSSRRRHGFVKTGAYGRAVADHAKKGADAVKAQMMKGDFVIFKGPLKDNTGNTVIPAGTAHKQTDVVLEQMNYLVEGVVGKV